MTVNGWKAEALNTAPDSQNEIHGDRVATQYGFKGGLVPGVTISAYLIHPAVQAWGMDFLTRGFAHVRVGSPLYDEEPFEVVIDTQDDVSYNARILRPDGTESANAEISLAATQAPAPARRGDPVADSHFVGPQSSFDTWTRLKKEGCLAFRYHWGNPHRMRAYVRDRSLMPDVHQGESAFANMGYVLSMSNWILASNAHMNPWIHLETHSQNYQPIPHDTDIIAEMSVVDFFEKKGHEFVDADIALFNEADDTCFSTIRLRAIYRLRGL
jgi:hypothetical protein